MTGRGRPVLWVGAAAVTSAVLRARFLATPLSVDEAGAVVIGRSWASGQRLYVDVFIDRPQGMLVAFRAWDAVVGPSLWTFRGLAIIAGIAVVLGAAVAAQAVARRWEAGAVAAWIIAVVSSSAAIEGHTANGELLAGALTVPAMAIGALVAIRRLGAPWLFAAGALAAGGITVKQSGFDALAAIGIWLLVASWQRWRPPREIAALVSWLAAGSGVILAAAAAHGARLGWDAYGYAIYGFRFNARSAVADPQGSRLVLTLLIALPLLGPTAILVWRHLRTLHRPWLPLLRPEHLLLAIWAGVAAAGFFAGGNYHRHYVIQLTFPFAILAGVAITAGPSIDRRRMVRTTALALALPLAISTALIVQPAWERNPRVDADAAIAQWVRSRRSSPTNDLLPLCASVTWYAEIGQQPRTPYLWVDHVRYGRNGISALIGLLDGPDRPAYLAMHDPASRCDPSGKLQRAIERNYRPATIIAGVAVLQALNP